MTSRKPSMIFRVVSATVLVCALGCVAAASAFAAPKLKVRTISPNTVRAGITPLLRFWVQNVGNSPTQGPITVVDTFGAPVADVEPQAKGLEFGNTGTTSSVTPIEAECHKEGSSLDCEVRGSLQPGVQVGFQVFPTVPEGATGSISDSIAASGGGTVGTVEADSTIAVGPPGPFGFDSAAVELSNADGSPDVLAGTTPAEYTTKLRWKSFLSTANPFGPSIDSNEFFNQVVAQLPPGLIGNPSASALCGLDELGTIDSEAAVQELPSCPPDSQVGVARVGLGGWYYTTGLFNMVAPHGSAAELGFNVFGTVILLGAYVRPGDHGINIVSRDTSTSVAVSAVEITVWGVPADPSHDNYRWSCVGNSGYGPSGLLCPTNAHRQAFLRMPTSCTGAPLVFGAESNSYEHPSPMQKIDFHGPTVAGCDMVPFAPSITVTPTTTATSSPTGVNVKLSLPQSKNPDGLAEGDLKKAVVTLPEGMSINPASADGLQACTDAQLHLDSNAPAECPDGSKIGTVLLHTQLIPNPIEGAIYIRPQNSNDPASGEMFRMVIELRDDAHGLDFKIPGHIQANPLTGRLTTTFDGNPQYPFEDISLQFKAGARSALSTPASCTTQTTEASLYPWARPEEATQRSDSFQLTSGPGGTLCPGPVLPFNPSFSAGVGDIEAGNYTPFVATFSRGDADESMQRVSVKMPKGLLGSLVGLPLCPEAQANAGTCSSASQIGTFTAGAGTGPTPFYVTGGKVYMTGPYEGAPFGLSVAVPAKAGPFDLGMVVVRSKVEVDIHTAQLTVTTDPLPQVVGGVPVDLRLVNVTIDRPHFTFNPTDCKHTEVTGSMTGVQGATAPLATGFQVTNCAALGFKPSFTASTSGKTSRQNGASLHVKLAYPKAAFGSQAYIRSVKVLLPRQLPSRLTTLQKACPDSVFNQDAAGCPAGSRVGIATSSTPILPVPLTGPAYFVSHGGAKFPELIVVLQGYGVTVDLKGETFINKAGITSSTFREVPDVPVSTFELNLPSGPNSALAANGNLCAQQLYLPTSFVAQNGATLKQRTRISVSGCKPAIRIVGHSVKGSHASISVTVPSAGTLVATGRYVKRSVGNVVKAGSATIGVTLTSQGLRVLAKNRHQRVNANVKLRFSSKHGAPLTAYVRLLMG